MTRLVLVDSKGNEKFKGRSDLPEGVQARQLLEKHGYVSRTRDPKNGQFEFLCPFHEESGSLPKGKPTNFYLNAKSSEYYCQSASCGEMGNLQSLEEYFGVENDPVLAGRYRSKDLELTEYQALLTDDRRDFLRKEKGLTDAIIDKFRLGWNKDKDCYVIPYLEQRRPVAFRFYDPTVRGQNEKGRDIYGGPNGSKYWWEYAGDSITKSEAEVVRLYNPASASGDPEHGRVFICEGELKALLMQRQGYAAVSIPGATSFKHEWARYFMHAREVVILMDNDNPESHVHSPCRKCEVLGSGECVGHNPGQEAAAKLLDFFGYRARNVVLPIPEGERKTDINEFIMRDAKTWSDFEMLTFGRSDADRFKVMTLEQISANPPPEAVFLVSDGLLPRGGRLLVTGAPKVGKSIFVENLVLSIASGVPFLSRFHLANTGIVPGHRVLLLDREVSKRSLYDRFHQLMQERPAYETAVDKLYIDHDFKLQLDAPNAVKNLTALVNANGVEVVVLDTAYKFFTGDMENAKSVGKAFATLDEVIADTGVSVVLTHHHRKGAGSGKESPNADQVMGSFLWTGWPNGTVLLNFKNRSVADPYTVVASFVAFRDAPAPDPLLLKRDKTSISYREVLPFSFDDLEEETGGSQSGAYRSRPVLSFDSLADLLMKAVPVQQDEFLHIAAAHFGAKIETVKMHLIDIGDRHPDFAVEGDGTKRAPLKWKYRYDKDDEPYDPAASSLDDDGQIIGQTNILAAMEELIS